MEVIEAAVLRLLLIEHPGKLRPREILETLNHPRDDRAVIEEDGTQQTVGPNIQPPPPLPAQ